DAVVIHPPVAVAEIRAGLAESELSAAEQEVLAALPEQFLLGASRLIPYKRLDLVIRTADDLGWPAVIAGTGPEEPALRRQAEAAGVEVQFLGAVSTPLLRTLYARAHVYLFPPVE